MIHAHSLGRAAWGELVAACVVRKPGMPLSENKSIAYCRRSLANYKIHAASNCRITSFRRAVLARS